MIDARLTLVETTEELIEFWQWLTNYRGEWLGCDTETGGLDWWREPLRVVQFGGPEAGWVIPWDRFGGAVQDVFDRWAGRVVFHNAKFDLHFLETNGVRVGRHRVHDTMFMCHLLEPHKPKGLKPASERWVDPRALVGEERLKKVLVSNPERGYTWRTVPIEFAPYWEYAALDPVLTARLAEVLYPKLTEDDRRVYDVDLGAAQVIADMERRGIRVDLEYARERVQTLLAYEQEVQQAVKEHFGVDFSLSRDAKLIEWFRREGVQFTKRTAKGRVAVDKEVLGAMNHPMAPFVLNWREANKKRTTYFGSWLEFEDGGVLHPIFNLLGAITARMSSERPNLQNVPRSKEVRRGLIPSDGNVLILADYDQIELRIMADQAGETHMVEAINAGNWDGHTYTARQVFRVDEPTTEQRRIAKQGNFAKIYVAGLETFANTVGLPLHEAKEFMDLFDAEFPNIKNFITTATNQRANEDGLISYRTPYIGRRQVAYASKAYTLVNYIIQGQAADVLKRHLIELANAGMSEYMTVPIHDEVAFDVPRDLAEEVARALPDLMEEREAFSVPLTVGVDIVENWGDKYE